MSHFKLTTETKTVFGRTLYRIEAVVDLPRHGVKAGDKGGFVEKEANLFDTARVSGAARVFGDAKVAEREHLLVVHPIGSERVAATLYRTLTGHTLAVGCWSGTVDDLAAEVERRSGNWSSTDADHERWKAEYGALEAMCRARIAGWTPPENGAER